MHAVHFLGCTASQLKKLYILTTMQFYDLCLYQIKDRQTKTSSVGQIVVTMAALINGQIKFSRFVAAMTKFLSLTPSFLVVNRKHCI